MRYAAHGPQLEINSRSLPKENVRQNTTILLRTLNTLMQTLKPLPPTRYLSMKLYYNADAPEEYEPKFFMPFQPADRNHGGSQHFEESPVVLKIGAIETGHHTLEMKLKAAEIDSFDDKAIEPDSERQYDSPPLLRNNDEDAEAEAEAAAEAEKLAAEAKAKAKKIYSSALSLVCDGRSALITAELARQLRCPLPTAKDLAKKMYDQKLLGPQRPGGRGRVVFASAARRALSVNKAGGGNAISKDEGRDRSRSRSDNNNRNNNTNRNNPYAASVCSQDSVFVSAPIVQGAPGREE